ncbi:hypothetical protein ES332_D10G224000v1 [Gossypium tomentosum]|uniref:Rhodanese domain-containing protein n=1 Tax=Gossypium tomentosum TaxID=34277 RepID=A0A5D2J8V9_GOSTO|nr:hypothetical protein ES332_D10G224000v1 [Gossypium tomentosum]
MLSSSSPSSSSLFFSNPKLYHLPSSPQPLFVLPFNSPLSGFCASSHPQRMTLSMCFSATTAADPIPTSDPHPPHSPDSQSLVVVSFYKFADFPDHADLRKPLKQLCQDLYVSGGIILAPEGINGSICGTRESVERVLMFIQTDDRLKGLRQIESPVSPEQEAIHHGHSSSSPLAAGKDAPFRWDHVRVKLKKEIVTLGMPDVSPIEKVGKYVSPGDWNALISDPDTVVIDVRNNYETRIGMFKGAVDPCTTAFRDFPSWVEEQFQPDAAKVEHAEMEKEGSNESINEDAEISKPKMPKRVAMYCTGGIRCEKTTSFMLSKGFEEVYHLKGGILKYLEEIPCGRASASCSTSELLSSMVLYKEISSFAMGVSSLLVMQTWKHQSGSMGFHVPTVTQRSLKKRKKGQGHDRDSSRPGELSAVLIRVGDQQPRQIV